MKISSLNPIGYEAQTKKGNTYKKSNAWTTGLVTAAAVTEILPYVIKNPTGKTIAKSFSIGQMMPAIVELTSKMKLTPKLTATFVAIGAAINIGTEFIAGRIMDKIVNKKRENTADKAAEAAQKD